MGMLIELASGTSDTLSHLIARDDDPPPMRPSEHPLDVSSAILAMRRTVEVILF